MTRRWDLLRTSGDALRRLAWLTVAMAAALPTGCSVYKIARAPGEKDLGVLEVGTPRAEVVREFGEPQFSYSRLDGRREDSWDFAQGRPVAWKIATAAYMFAIDVSTLGGWELREYVVDPAERVLDEELWFKKGRRLIVTFDSQRNVETVVTLAAPLPADGPAPTAASRAAVPATSPAPGSAGS